MSKLFILGSGFSKAVSSEMPTKMPTMEDLGTHIQNKIHNLPGETHVYEALISDPMNIEQLLTYLYQEMPWQTKEQIYANKSAFFMISRLIVDHISECEHQVFEQEDKISKWAKDFVRYLDKHKATVATFNYDTVLEGLSALYIDRTIQTKIVGVGISNYYQMPIKHVVNRAESNRAVATNPERHNTYRLIKVHGSINWHFSGSETAPDQQIYYSNELVRASRLPHNLDELRRNIKGLEPLIIPPITEKSSFYAMQLVKSLWADLYTAVTESDELYFIGYSLPKTDLTTRLFFSAATAGQTKEVYIVNRKQGSSELLDNYRQTLPQPHCKVIDRYISDHDPIGALVHDLPYHRPSGP